MLKKGHILPITSETLKATHINKHTTNKNFLFLNSESAGSILYTITEPPKFGKLQFRFQNFYEDLTGPYASLNKFTQNDIDEGTQDFYSVTKSPAL